MKTIPKIGPIAATLVAERCEDAYSFDDYGHQEWAKAGRMLARRGYDARQIEAILRSKWTRWASDDATDPRHGHAKNTDLARFLNKQKNLAKQVEQLTRETFPEGGEI